MSSLQFSGWGPSPADEKSISNKREKVKGNITNFARDVEAFERVERGVSARVAQDQSARPQPSHPQRQRQK